MPLRLKAMNKTPRLLMIVPSLRVGGAERQAVELAVALSRGRFRVHLVTFDKGTDLLDEMGTDAVAFTSLSRKGRFDSSAANGIARLIRDENIDIVHCTLQIAYLYGWLGRRRSGRKPALICALHTTVNRDLKDEFFDRLLYAPLLALSDGIITVCRSQQRYWSRKFPWLGRKIVTVHNGVDTDRYRDVMSPEEKSGFRASLNIGREDFVAAMVAGLRPEKGHAFALKAVRRLVEAGRNIKLILVGDGEKKREMEALSRDLGLEGIALWVGGQKDPRPYLGVSDVLLIASYAVETFPLSALEALSMGKPVVASAVGGIPELVRDGQNGLLVAPRDIGALADALERVLLDRDLRAKLSANARGSVLAGFTSADMVKSTEDALKRFQEGDHGPA